MSEIARYDYSFRDRISCNDLPEELIIDGQYIDKKFEDVNLEIINHIKKQLNSLNDILKSGTTIFKITEAISNFVESLKRSCEDFKFKSPNEVSTNSILITDENNINYNKINQKSNSLLSIVDIKMEITDNDIFDKKFNDLEINENSEKKPSELVIRQPSVLILRDRGMNTELDISVQETQTCPGKKDKNFDMTSGFLYLRGQTKEIQNLSESAIEKYKTIEGKVKKAYDHLTTFNGIYQSHLDKIRSEKISIGLNTCSSWMLQWDKMVRDSRQLVDTSEDLRSAQTTIQQYEKEIELLKSQNREQKEQIDQLTTDNDELQLEKEGFQSELSEVRDTNEFLNAENQGLIVQMDKMQEDWKSSLKLSDDQIRRLKAEFREERTRFALDRRDFEFDFEQEKLHNSLDKKEVEFLQKRLEKYMKDVENYPAFGSDLHCQITELKKKVSHLEDKRLAHAQEKDKFLKLRERMVEEVNNGNKRLNQKIILLTERITAHQEGNSELRGMVDKYMKCFDELRKVNLDPQCREPNKFGETVRNILSAHDV